MNRSLMPGFAAALALTALAVALASCRGTEEDTSQVATDAPTASATPGKTPATSATSTPAPISTPPTPAATLTYTDPTYGYSFEYPASWQISKQPEAGSIILYSYDLASVPPEDAGKPVPADKLKVFVWVAEGVDKPVEQWLEEGRAQASLEQNLTPPPVLARSPVILGGRQGLVEVIQSEAYGIRDKSYYVPLDGQRVFVVNTVPADSQLWPEFEKVLATLQFQR